MAGSFRDPSGYVFSRQGRIFRAIDAVCATTLEELHSQGLLPALIEDGSLVQSQFVAEPLKRELADEHPGFTRFLEHAPVVPITYPYEWSPSMLADAGVRTLDLQMALLAAGYALKDATPYNVQFVRGCPIFIDLGSIEKPERLDLWFALGQFERMFLLPLLLCQRAGWDLASYFRANLDGRSLQQVRQSLSWLDLCRPGLLLDVTFPLLLEAWTQRRQVAPKRPPRPPRAGPQAQLLNLKRLRGKVRRLAVRIRYPSSWLDYEARGGASDAEAKARLIREFLNRHRPGRVLDLGCNQGRYSLLAAESGASVVAADADAGVVDRLYLRLRQQPTAVTPVVQDLANPSPPLGYLNQERTSFFERMEADCVLALALVHHLLVAANLSLARIRDLLCCLSRRHVVLEFVPRGDPGFERLLTFRRDLFSDYTLEAVLATFADRFKLLAQEPLPGSGRILLFWERPGVDR